jgi:prepilin-type N-terminal cleavage/methylation domain-containing protein/prepilin-type processing-associated H-X9-DG protein
MKKKGFTLIELLVVIAIIAMLLAILMPALNKVKKIAQRVVCATNLKGLGTALIVYANDYEDDFVVQGDGFNHAWSDQTGGWQAIAPPWSNELSITVGASLYLLVREADVSPKSFICAGGSQKEFDGENGNDLDLVELYDFGGRTFGDTPRICVSYAYHMPYSVNGTAGRFAADGSRSASFAVMADKNPWMDPKLKLPDSDMSSETWFDYVARMGAYYDDETISESDWRVKRANAQAHGREGQNVLFGDGHASYEKTTDVGVKHDSIYTIQGGAGDIEDIIRQGQGGQSYLVTDLAACQPVSGDDSFLVNDDDRNL